MDIILDHVSFKYNNQQEEAVSDVSMIILNGKINGLLGPNGAGKSTLIHIICSLIKPPTGKVYQSINGSEPQDLNKNQIGFVPQQDGLFGDLTLSENLKYYGGLYSLAKNTIKNRIEYYAEYLHLKDHLKKQIKHFSGGMNRRANIIAGLLHDPEFIILDEPTAGVDIQSRALIHEVIKDLQFKGKTLLYTSHLLSEAEELCDNIFIMDHGRMLCNGSPQSLINDTQSSSIEKLFLSLTGSKVRD